MASFFLGTAGGIVAWFVTMLIGQPVLSFFALRRQVIKALVHYNAAGIDDRAQSSKWLEERSTILRTHGSELVAFATTEPLAPWILDKFHIVPLHAGICLINLAALSPGDPIRKQHYNDTLNALRVSHWVL